MKFFEVRASVDPKLLVGAKKQPKWRRSQEFAERMEEYAKEICIEDKTFAEKAFGRDVFINFSSIDQLKAVVIMATERDGESKKEIERLFEAYLARHGYKGNIMRLEEITGKSYRNMLKDADRNDFIDDYDDAMESSGMKVVGRQHYHSFPFEEYLIDEDSLSYEEALYRADRMKTAPELKDEIERIYTAKRKKWQPGNPVHYIISADFGKDRDEYFMLLLKALYACNRVDSKRFTQIDYEELCDYYSESKLDEIYRLQTGGAVVLNIGKEEALDGDILTGNESRAKEVCRMAMKWKSRVLSIFLFSRDSEKIQEVFCAEMDGISLIKITDGIIFDEDAKAFLKQIAAENKVKAYGKLFKNVEPGAGYSKRDLRKIFDDWHENYLKEKVFPQYAKDALIMAKAEMAPKGSAFSRLNELIGLDETKALVSNILDFAKAQQLYTGEGKRRKQALHMIFSGNPGTAKTTVARLVAQILKENEVLKNGDLIEVGRADLVGKYVGHTAPLVKRAFRQANGSVLFIDEAYSLVDDRDGLFGDEAINTIVQEMENKRDEVVVIFAGYPDKMEGFLAKNPGLRSRIGFHVNFPDYSPAELFDILELLAREDSIVLSEDVRERVSPIIEKAAGIKEFGNGRYVRNMLEKACMRQATRLIRMEQSKVTEQVAATLIAEDFEEVRLSVCGEERKIGFL